MMNIVERLIFAEIASCNCDIKTHDVEFHSEQCPYRLYSEASAEITRLRADLKVAAAESAALQAGLVDAIFQKKLIEGYKVDAAEMHAKAFVDWSLTQLRNELALIERDE